MSKPESDKKTKGKDIFKDWRPRGTSKIVEYIDPEEHARLQRENKRLKARLGRFEKLFDTLDETEKLAIEYFPPIFVSDLPEDVQKFLSGYSRMKKQTQETIMGQVIIDFCRSAIETATPEEKKKYFGA